MNYEIDFSKQSETRRSLCLSRVTCDGVFSVFLEVKNIWIIRRLAYTVHSQGFNRRCRLMLLFIWLISFPLFITVVCVGWFVCRITQKLLNGWLWLGLHSSTVHVETQCKAASSQWHSPPLNLCWSKSRSQENMDFGLSHGASMSLVWDIVKMKILEEQNVSLVVWGVVPYLYSCPKTIFYCAEEPVIHLALRATQPPE